MWYVPPRVAKKLTVPIHQARIAPLVGEALVLDVGSGHRPHFRADVLCDRSLGHDIERGKKGLRPAAA